MKDVFFIIFIFIYEIDFNLLMENGMGDIKTVIRQIIKEELISESKKDAIQNK